MINSSDKNPELTFDQLQAMDVVQKRLSNLETEISIAQKNLLIEKKEVVKATKEREYQEELLGKLNAEIPLLEEKKEKLEIAIKEMEDYLTRASDEDRMFKTEQTKIESEHVERENSIREKEIKLMNQSESLRKEVSEFKVEKEKLLDFKEALSVVIKNW